MLRFTARALIAIAAAFIVCPIASALGLAAYYGVRAPGDLLIGMYQLFFLQFFLPLRWWVAPLALGWVAGLVWHCVAEASKNAGERAP